MDFIGLIIGTIWMGLGIALKPSAIVIGIVISSRNDPWRRGLAYLGGWLTGLLVLLLIPSLYLHDLLRIPKDVARDHLPGYDMFRAALGVILLIAAAFTVFRGPLPDDELPDSRWTRMVESGTVFRVFGIGVILSAFSFRNLLLTAAAGSVIDQSNFEPLKLAIIVTVFLATASLGILLPLLLQRFGGVLAKAWLQKGTAWLTAHLGMVTGLMMALLGVLLLTRGLQGLL